jgi:hypothetical protein
VSAAENGPRRDDEWLPLYEAKMIHHFNPRWATYRGDGSCRELTEAEHADTTFATMPRYWVSKGDVETRLAGWDRQALLGWREVARNTDERTIIASVIPRAGVGHKYQLVFPSDPDDIEELEACLSSFVFDFVARQKLGGTAVSYFVMKQLPVPCPREVRHALRGLLGKHIDRPALDASLFLLYGVPRDDVAHILDTFSIISRREIAEHGEYRTKRLILEAFDAASAPTGDAAARR